MKVVIEMISMSLRGLNMLESNLQLNWIKYAFTEDREQGVIEKFIYVWFAFNSYYGEYLFVKDGDTGEVKSRNELSAIIKSLNVHHTIDINFFKSKECFQFFTENDIKNMQRNWYLTAPYRGYDIYSCELRKWLKGYLKIIYGVRCNLFHGSKHAYDKKDMKIIGNALQCLCWLLVYFCHDDSLKREIKNNRNKWDCML